MESALFPHDRKDEWKGAASIEDLLGWNRPVGMLNRVMAGHLGITERQLKYLTHRQHEQVKEEERRRSERDAKAIMFVPQISHKVSVWAEPILDAG